MKTPQLVAPLLTLAVALVGFVSVTLTEAAETFSNAGMAAPSTLVCPEARVDEPQTSTSRTTVRDQIAQPATQTLTLVAR